MVSLLERYVARSVRYLKEHPHIVLVLLLLVLLPLLFIFTNQQFLKAGLHNQERLQKDRVGMLHDVFVSLLYATDFTSPVVQAELERTANANSDITHFLLLEKEQNTLRVIAAADPASVGATSTLNQYFKSAAGYTNETLIFETSAAGERQWQTYRFIETPTASYYLVTTLSLVQIDTAFEQTERAAMGSLLLVYALVAALAWWHIRLADYKYLYQEVQKANETKDLFTNMIAHELRAPLTAIRGYSSMLEERLKGDDKVQLERVRLSAERLIALVNDLLDVARIQSGKLAVEIAPCDISKTITSVIDELSISAKEKNITLGSRGTDTEHLVYADAKRLHQAMINLVSNAIKYTKEGAITLALYDKRDVVEIRVEDTGMGISAEDQKKVFAPFFRVKSEAMKNVTGTGLGMWITKQMIELMGGLIVVESIKGVGTHVVVTLPKPKKTTK